LPESCDKHPIFGEYTYYFSIKVFRINCRFAIEMKMKMQKPITFWGSLQFCE
jgi:hypothetical protein